MFGIRILALATALALGTAGACPAQQARQVVVNNIRIAVPENCEMEFQYDQNLGTAACTWTDASRWILSLVTWSDTQNDLPQLPREMQSTIMQNLCRTIAELRLKDKPSDCRASDVALADALPGEVPKGAEFCSHGTGTLHFASGDVVHREVLACHLPVTGERATLFLVDVLGDADPAKVSALAQEVFQSVTVGQ